MEIKEEADWLLSFHAMVLHQGISRAALALGVAKSTLSGHLRQLEERYGVRLIQRTSRQFQLTSAGDELFRHACTLVETLERTRNQLSVFSEQVQGLIRLTAPLSSGAHIMPILIREFRERYPLTRFDLRLSNDQLDLLQERIDVGFRGGDPGDESLVARQLTQHMRVRRILVAAPEWLARHPLPASPEQFADDTVIYLPFDQWQLQHEQGQRLTVTPEPVVTCNTMESAVQLCCQGLGVGLVTEFSSRDAIAQGRLVRVFSQWSAEDYPYYLVYPSRMAPSVAVRRFIDFTCEAFAQGRFYGIRPLISV
ncbi:hypothetical protein C4K68_22110 [Pokkaliibacter plantistimulans]|uniref:HTH lysR-type domain-containing protein n=1 Tax=Proteobacteria bacterium 228 TaxID=2083153 RepID=A0A2S5KLY8_9PROT|nr:LysR family transcriptional regulator [Pokkaliibacter plantistimulans]PPC75326.1 hypothetical protein C4K68_22110 [Pokkaliibacter plantistimulans]